MSKYSSKQEIDELLKQAIVAFNQFRKYSHNQRATVMRAVADSIEALGDELIQTAMAESNLPLARLTGEKGRTIFQWRSYADAIENGYYLGASIDTALPDRTPPKPDIRKTSVPLGPVAVFGASNFPFAFSTAGGDTASAIAAGCPVIVKAHPGHEETSAIMAGAIAEGMKKAGAPEGLFAHVYCESLQEAQYLVLHPAVKAVGFTGSYRGGKALVDLAATRPEPIPVFAEMGSVNPVFVLEGRLAAEPEVLAKQYVGSLTLGVGQFCTNPGIVVAKSGEALEQFITSLAGEIAAAVPAPMLNQGIWSAYESNKSTLIEQNGVALIAESAAESATGFGRPTVATVSATEFLANSHLAEEVFGPFALIVTCSDDAELQQVAESFTGQLTATFLGTSADLESSAELLSTVQYKCGRIMFNNFPTGVEVCQSMHHGGPFPSSSNGQYTSVGPDSIKRFVRPLSFQSWPDDLLPEELKSSNPLGIFRIVNNVLTKDPI